MVNKKDDEFLKKLDLEIVEKTIALKALIQFRNNIVKPKTSPPQLPNKTPQK